MRRGPPIALAAALAASAAGAECLDLAANPPVRATLTDGLTVDLLGREGDVLHYRTTGPGQPDSEMRAHLGTVPLWNRRGGDTVRFEWDGPLPAAAAMVPGARFELLGRVVAADGGSRPLALGITVGEAAVAEVDGCPIAVLRTTLRFGPPARPVSRSERLWDPVTLLSFVTETTAFGAEGRPPRTRTYRTLALQ
jgi:hypothetical protein